MGWERAPLHFLTGLRPLQAQGPPEVPSVTGGGKGELGFPLPCIGCGRGGGGYIQSQQPPTSNAAKHWCEEGGLGASSSKTFPPGPSPPYCFREKIVFSRTLNTVETREKQVGDRPLRPPGQFDPPTLTQVPLWCKKKKKKKRSLWG